MRARAFLLFLRLAPLLPLFGCAAHRAPVRVVELEHAAPAPAAAELAAEISDAVDQVEEPHGPLLASADGWLPRLELEVFGQTGAATPVGGGTTAPTWTATSTVTALRLKSGAKITMDWPTNSHYFMWSGSAFLFVGGPLSITQGSKLCFDNGTCGRYLTFDGTNTYNVGGNLVNNDGAFISGAATSMITYGVITSNQGSGSNALALATNGARVDLGTGANDYWYSDGSNVRTPGNVIGGNASFSYVTINSNGSVLVNQADASGSPGNCTINNPSGFAAVASGATSITVTNSTVTGSDRIIITPMASSATNCAGWYVSAIASGSFTLTCPSATTASWKFSFFVLH